METFGFVRIYFAFIGTLPLGGPRTPHYFYPYATGVYFEWRPLDDFEGVIGEYAKLVSLALGKFRKDPSGFVCGPVPSRGTPLVWRSVSEHAPASQRKRRFALLNLPKGLSLPV